MEGLEIRIPDVFFHHFNRNSLLCMYSEKKKCVSRVFSHSFRCFNNWFTHPHIAATQWIWRSVPGSVNKNRVCNCYLDLKCLNHWKWPCHRKHAGVLRYSAWIGFNVSRELVKRKMNIWKLFPKRQLHRWRKKNRSQPMKFVARMGRDDCYDDFWSFAIVWKHGLSWLLAEVKEIYGHSVVWWSKMGSTAKINLAWFSNKRHIVFTVALICCCDDPSSILCDTMMNSKLSIELMSNQLSKVIRCQESMIWCLSNYPWFAQNIVKPTNHPTQPTTPRIPAESSLASRLPWHSERVFWLMSNLQLQVDLGWDGRHPSITEWLKNVFFYLKEIYIIMNPTKHHGEMVVGEKSFWYLKTFFEGFHADEEW